jgi:hypothetical protein
MQMAGAPIDDQFMWDKTRIDFLPMDTFGRAETKSAGYREVGGRKIFELWYSGGVQTSQIQYPSAHGSVQQSASGLELYDTLAVPALLKGITVARVYWGKEFRKAHYSLCLDCRPMFI